MTKDYALYLLNKLCIGASVEAMSIIPQFELAQALSVAIKALEQQPKWIPCTERLPKNDEDVLVCYSQGAMEVCYYHIDNTFYPTEYKDLNETGWFNENGDALYFEPVAWMPLPEVYAESEDKK